MATVGVILVAIYSFFNGALWAIVETRRVENELPFFVEWNKEVAESQDSTSGRIMMKFFYFIPTGVALISKLRFKLRSEESLS